MLCSIIETVDRSLALIVGRALDAQGFFVNVVPDIPISSTDESPAKNIGGADTNELQISAGGAKIRDSRNLFYTISTLPVCGVIPSLTECYAVTCSDFGCYASSCPRSIVHCL